MTMGYKIGVTGVTYIPSLVSFGVCSGSEKFDRLGHKEKKINKKNNRVATTVAV